MEKDVDDKVKKTEDEVVDKKPTKKKRGDGVEGKVNNAIDTEPTLAEMEEGEDSLTEAPLSMAQRRKRGMTMRKYAAKIKAARQRAKRRMPTNDRIKKLARKKARNIVRQKLIGKMDKKYDDLDTAQKITLDKRLDSKKPMIDKIAKRILPKVKKEIMQRRSKMNEEFENIFEGVAQDKDIADRAGTQPAKYHSGLAKSTKAKRDAHFKKSAEMDDDNPNAYKPAPGDSEAKTKESKYTKKYREMYGEQTGAPTKRFHIMHTKEGKVKLDRRFRAFKNAKKLEEGPILDRAREEMKREREALKREHEREIRAAKIADARATTNEYIELENDEQLLELVDQIWEEFTLEESKVNTALQKKADKSGISYGILKKVYDRGVAAWRTGHRPGTTPAQWGMARVNSFITGGKTRTTGDADLAKKLKESDDMEKYEAVSPAQQAAIAIAKKRKAMKEEVELDSFFDLNESFELSEESILDKALAAIHKYVTTGTELSDIAFRVSRAKDVNMTGRELARKYVERYGEPAKKSKVDQSKAAALKKKYGFSEEGGAGDWGTDELVKRYKKDTPGEDGELDLNESFEMIMEDAQCALISRKDMRELEKFADTLLKVYGLDIEFTRHFGDRMSDDRNNPCITVGELKNFFRKIYANKGAKIKGNVGIEAVLNDVQRKLNMPVIIDRKRNGEVEVRFKTIMRKNDFKTPNRKIPY